MLLTTAKNHMVKMLIFTICLCFRISP